MFLLLMVVLSTSGVWALAAWWFVFRPVAQHIQGDAEASQAVTLHVILPILGKPPKIKAEKIKEPSKESAKETETNEPTKKRAIYRV